MKLPQTKFGSTISEFTKTETFEEIGRTSILAETVKTMEPKDDCNDTTNSKSGDCPNTYLNEIETWKGMNRDPQKRGKFLRPCSDIQH